MNNFGQIIYEEKLIQTSNASLHKRVWETVLHYANFAANLFTNFPNSSIQILCKRKNYVTR